MCCRSAPSLRFNPMPPRTTQKSYRPRVSHRIMVGNLASTFACVASGTEGVEYHRVMKPSSGKHQRGRCRWNARRAQGGQDQNPSRTEMGLDASNNMHVPLEGRGRFFSLTSPLIGRLTFTAEPLMRNHSCGSEMGRSACYSITCASARGSVARVWLCSALIYTLLLLLIAATSESRTTGAGNRQCRLGPWHLSHLVQDLGGEPQVTHFEHVRNFGEPHHEGLRGPSLPLWYLILKTVTLLR
jgi:hypothetical protein